MPSSKVELYPAICRDARAGLSGRAIERKYRVDQARLDKLLSEQDLLRLKDT
jgi:hypothetical protein